MNTLIINSNTVGIVYSNFFSSFMIFLIASTVCGLTIWLTSLKFRNYAANDNGSLKYPNLMLFLLIISVILNMYISFVHVPHIKAYFSDKDSEGRVIIQLPVNTQLVSIDKCGDYDYMPMVATGFVPRKYIYKSNFTDITYIIEETKGDTIEVLNIETN